MTEIGTKRLRIALIVLTSILAIGVRSRINRAEETAALDTNARRAVTYQINTAHTGAIEMPGFRPPLSLRWSVTLPGSVSYPIIAGGAVFVTAQNSGTDGTSLWALDEQNGNSLWGPVSLGGTSSWSNAAYDAGKIFVVTFEGLLRCYDATTGALIWSQQLPGQYAFSSPPTAASGIVYVGGAGSGGTLYAVSETDGTVLWTRDVANGDHSSPALLGQTVFVSYACANSYAFNRRSGTPLWTFTTGCEGGGGRTPVAYQGIVYVRDFVTSPYYMLDAATGAQVGSFLAGPPPAFARNTGVYLYNGQLRAVDVGTGTELWQFTGDGALSSAPIIVNGTVYIGSSTGRLFGLDLGTGGLLWQGNAGASILPPDEQNVAAPLTGFGAAEDLLVVPAGNLLVAFEGRTHP